MKSDVLSLVGDGVGWEVVGAGEVGDCVVGFAVVGDSVVGAGKLGMDLAHLLKMASVRLLGMAWVELLAKELGWKLAKA